MPKKRYTHQKGVNENNFPPGAEDGSAGDEVRLKPFLGIKPGRYLACIYGAAVLLILFFTLFYPGMKNPGSVVAVKSEPRGAAVKVDGVYMAAAPCEIFVPAGRRVIEISLPGFDPVSVEKDIGARLFASALFPLKTEIRGTLEARHPSEAFLNEAAEYAAWTFAGEPTAAYQVPRTLSEGVYRFAPAVGSPAARKSMNDTVFTAARFAVTQAALRDLVRAKTLLDNRGLSPSPVSLLASAEDITAYLDENPKAALALASLLSGEAQSAVAGSPWYAGAARGGDAAQSDPLPLYSGDSVQNTRAGGFVTAGTLGFRFLPGGLPLLGGNFPPGETVDDFYICETTVSAAAWENFLAEEPRWKKENSSALVQDGRATGDYLESQNLPGAPEDGVSAIPWYAAEAFCAWLTASLPAPLSSWEARLPTEAEWEYAAKSGAVTYGQFWEWCHEPYAPLPFLSVPPDAILFSPERPLRGGSWVNRLDSAGAETRGSLPPEFCSPFVSFRPVLVRKAAP